MSLNISLGPGGQPTASSGGVRLHSAYRPDEEAERQARSADVSASAFIVLGGCLGYLFGALKRLYPGVPVFSIQYHPGFRGHEVYQADAAWYPDHDESIEAFLQSILDAEDLESLRVMEWEPAVRAFPETARAAEQALRSALLALNGTANSLAVFGRAFLYNPPLALSNEGVWIVPGDRGDIPCVIAAAGPSLEEALPLLIQAREDYFLACLSSALPALVLAGIRPDMVFSADAGYWAQAHLNPGLMAGLPLAAPLEARIPPGLRGCSPRLLLRRGGAYEDALLGPRAPRGVRAPTTATVAAQTLEACAALSSGPIIMAGLDLSSRDIRSHARPNALDAYVTRDCGRLSPAHALIFERETGLFPRRLGDRRFSPQFETYAAWLARVCHGSEKIFRLAPGAPPLEGLRDLDGPAFLNLVHRRGRPPVFSEVSDMPPPGCIERALFLIRDSMEAFASDDPLSGLQREVCACACMSSHLKRRKALRDANPGLKSIAVEEMRGRMARIERRLLALKGGPA
jgi:hypothetical protein